MGKKERLLFFSGYTVRRLFWTKNQGRILFIGKDHELVMVKVSITRRMIQKSDQNIVRSFIKIFAKILRKKIDQKRLI